MEICPVRPDDLKNLSEIDATIHAAHYLHVDQSGDGVARAWKLEERNFRSPQITSNPLGDEASFLARQIAAGAEEGFALLAEHDDMPVALLLADLRPQFGTLHIAEIRVDFDFRRQGLATAMIYQSIAYAREHEIRAVCAETLSSNGPAHRLLAKCGFDLTGLDTRRLTNHDLVKESATLLWYAALD